MNVREVLEVLLAHALDGRGTQEPVFVMCDGNLRTIEGVEIRLVDDGDDRPKETFVLIVTDGPAEVLSPSPITTRSPRK